MSGVPLHSIRDVWYHNLEKFPGKLAVIDEGKSHHYRECDLLSDRLRRELATRYGFRPGDKVAIAGPNCFEYYITYWAVMKSGGVAVPVNTRLGSEEMRHVLDHSDAAIWVVHRDIWPAVREAASGCTALRHVVGMRFSEPGIEAFDSLVAQGENWDFRPEIREEDLGIIMHTSGTTGRPKGAMMRHGDLLFNNKLAIYAHGLRHEDVHMLVVPMFHATALYSLLPTSALLGSTIVLSPKTDIRYLVELIQTHRITTFFGVPTLFHFLSLMKGLDQYDLSSLRLIAYAGSPMPPVTIRKLRTLFPHILLHNFFGLTETISMTHVLPSQDADVRPESIGKLLPHVSQCILDEGGNELPPGQVGELHFHRSNVIPGYWKEPGRLEQAMRGEWFNTGDLALVDEEGYVYLKGRSKDMIIVGGENVYALEVENCIMTHEKVLEAAVIGVPATGVRAYLGELVKAVVVTRPGSELAEAEIKRHCVERLASYKVPQFIEFRSELPRNASGKVLKRLL
ncbi:MAG: AMP-binding protein [Planctomycetes bacterium]|nr:AMP-binding protein [Planctomycetota bacterium]